MSISSGTQFTRLERIIERAWTVVKDTSRLWNVHYRECLPDKIAEQSESLRLPRLCKVFPDFPSNKTLQIRTHNVNYFLAMSSEGDKMLTSDETSRTLSSRVATIGRHISPTFLSARSSPSSTQWDVDAMEKLGVRVETNVRRALLEGLPVVALESTIISHGMPYPQNLQTAKEVENIVRKNGATPATVAILGGVPYVGLNEEELEHLAQLGTKAVKTSTRDIAQVIAKGADGATTVSATMFFAAKAGIRVFVTGGIGGVHRGGETTLDISADLTELGRIPIAVICAGVKSILDIPKTLEYLETQGVTVIGYGTDEFPAFFTPKSGCKVPCRIDTPEGCAAIIATNLRYKLAGGILVGVPIPKEYAADAEPIETVIQNALEEARQKNIQGNAVTPYLLKRINELSGGASLAANIELIKNNALVGTRIAVALTRQLRSSF